MVYTSLSSWGSPSSSSTIKRLIIWTSVISLLAATTQAIFDHFELFPGPQAFLSLSWWGMARWFLWQPISYFFTINALHGLSFSFLITLFFSMYVLGVIGTPVLELIGRGPFLRLYFISGIAAGLIALLSMPITGQYTFLATPAAPILALLTVWSLAFPEADILLFFLIPIKAKWLVAAIVGIVLLNAISLWDISSLILYISGVLIGYGYATIAWGWHSPFPHTRKIDDALTAFGLKLRHYLPHWRRRINVQKEQKKGSKIVDLHTGQKLDDEAFVDAMLAKISRSGEQSLTWSERRRLQEISERKTKM